MNASEHTDSRDLLALSRYEITVFNALSKTAQSRTELQRITKLPSTSVLNTLRKLHARGLARKVRIGARIHWKRAPITSLYKRVNALKTFLAHTNEYEKTLSDNTVWNEDAIDVRIVSGHHKIHDVHSYAYATKSSHRLFLTQIKAALRAIFAEPRALLEIQHVTSLAGKTKNIVEILASEGAEDVWHSVAQKKSLAQETTKRVIDASVVSRDIMSPDTPAELFIFGDTTMITDWEHKVGVVVRNTHIANLLTSLFRATKGHGDSTNPNEIFLKRLKKTND